MIFIGLAALIFIGEYIIKNFIEQNKEMNKDEEILNGNIILTRYHNKGAMLNFLEKKSKLVVLISGILLGGILVLLGVLIPKKGNGIMKLGLAMLVGGAASNVYDRVQRGYVVDYFSFKWLKNVVFNIADIFIIVGSVIVGVCSVFKKGGN